MSFNAGEFLALVKRAAVDAVDADAPMGFCFGIVTSAAPLKIMVDQKKILTETQLILTNNVRDFAVEMTTLPEYHETENASGGSGDTAYASHKHKYQGRKKWLVHLALNVGEKVILLRCDGGQRYIVLDRWEALT